MELSALYFLKFIFNFYTLPGVIISFIAPDESEMK